MAGKKSGAGKKTTSYQKFVSEKSKEMKDSGLKPTQRFSKISKMWEEHKAKNCK